MAPNLLQQGRIPELREFVHTNQIRDREESTNETEFLVTSKCKTCIRAKYSSFTKLIKRKTAQIEQKIIASNALRASSEVRFICEAKRVGEQIGSNNVWFAARCKQVKAKCATNVLNAKY